MICPCCDGEKKIYGIFPVYVDDVPKEKRKPVIEAPCDFCGATGNVDNNYPELYKRGEEAKQKRLNAGLTLRKFCERFNFDTLSVSYFERGKRVKDEKFIIEAYEVL